MAFWFVFRLRLKFLVFLFHLVHLFNLRVRFCVVFSVIVSFGCQLQCSSLPRNACFSEMSYYVFLWTLVNSAHSLTEFICYCQEHTWKQTSTDRQLETFPSIPDMRHHVEQHVRRRHRRSTRLQTCFISRLVCTMTRRSPINSQHPVQVGD